MSNQVERPETHPPAGWRIVVADDHELLREGIATVIAREPELTICGQADNEATALELIERHRPELLLIDLSICRRDGLSFLRDLLATYPAIRVLALAAYAEELYAKRLLSSGASGYLIKSVSGAELVRAVRVVAGGEIYAHHRPDAAGKVAAAAKSIAQSTSRASLSPTSAPERL